MTQTLVAAVVGLAAGFFGSMPLTGPIAALIVQRLLERRKSSAVLTALGASLIEGVYVVIIALALPTLLRRFDVFISISRGVGAIVVTAVGLLLLYKPGIFQSKKPPAKPSSVLMGAAIAAFNPTLLATWAIVVSTLYSSGLLQMHTSDAVAFSVGVVLGINAWFALLAVLSGLVVHRIRATFAYNLMRAFGVVLVGAGLILALRVIHEL